MVLRIPGRAVALRRSSRRGCNGCHSVSADGSRLLSQFVPGNGNSYVLAVGGAANPPANAAGPRAAFGAFYPDGSKYLAQSAVTDVARFADDAPRRLGAPQAATLYGTRPPAKS